MALIQDLDFIGIPSQDAARARSFYRDVLGMRPDEYAEYEQWEGSTCFVMGARASRDGVRRPNRQSPATARTGRPRGARVPRVQGCDLLRDTLDTGVCHMAIFADPDGNQLLLHHRYAPYENA